MIWLFLDGTSFELGGEVRGDSDFARALRLDVDDVRRGQPPRVTMLAPLREDLDLDSADHVDVWLREEGRRQGVELAAAPDFARREDDPGSEDGVEY